MKDLDRKIVKLLARDEGLNQSALAAALDTDITAVRRELLRLSKSGVVKLASKGRPPRLQLFVILDDVKAAIGNLLEAA